MLGLIWTVLIRIPIVLYAEDHLDSDLAVDGLTLLEATQGNWRWHYPGTPHIGTPAVVLSWVQAKIWGVDSQTLVSGGTVAACLILTSTFLTIWRVFGHRIACWSLVPTVFSSLGTIWLSSRITGGHLLVTAWSAGALALMFGCWTNGGSRRSLIFGLWCGFGYYIDSMILLVLISIIVPTTVIGWRSPTILRSKLVFLLLFGVGFAVGQLPRELGKRLEPHDAYQGQFDPIFQRDVLAEHTQILFTQCLPRLIGGHTFHRFGPEPPASKLPGRGASLSASPQFDLYSAITTIISLTLFVAGIVMILRKSVCWPISVASSGVASSLLILTVGVLAAFIINRNIFNSDNYRYLVFLLIPWSLGFGLLLDALASRGNAGRIAAILVGLGFAGMMTLDVYRGYRHYGWIEETATTHRLAPTDPAVLYFRAHPDATRIYGDYWDVYRLSFLTLGRLLPRPLGIYPDRFPEWKSKNTESDVYLVAHGGRVPTKGWIEPVPLRGMQIYRWNWSRPPQNRQPWD